VDLPQAAIALGGSQILTGLLTLARVGVEQYRTGSAGGEEAAAASAAAKKEGGAVKHHRVGGWCGAVAKLGHWLNALFWGASAAFLIWTTYEAFHGNLWQRMRAASLAAPAPCDPRLYFPLAIIILTEWSLAGLIALGYAAYAFAPDTVRRVMWGSGGETGAPSRKGADGGEAGVGVGGSGSGSSDGGTAGVSGAPRAAGGDSFVVMAAGGGGGGGAPAPAPLPLPAPAPSPAPAATPARVGEREPTEETTLLSTPAV
jgi:hypothetical protein